jgi:hypothetical protein
MSGNDRPFWPSLLNDHVEFPNSKRSTENATGPFNAELRLVTVPYQTLQGKSLCLPVRGFFDD